MSHTRRQSLSRDGLEGAAGRVSDTVSATASTEGSGGALSGKLTATPSIKGVYDSNIHAVIDFAAIVGFDWDSGNARKGDKHGVTMAEAEQLFFNTPLLVLDDEPHSHSEPRFHALGITDEGRRLHITFTLRGSGQLIRVISARDMHRKERIIYEQARD